MEKVGVVDRGWIRLVVVAAVLAIIAILVIPGGDVSAQSLDDQPPSTYVAVTPERPSEGSIATASFVDPGPVNIRSVTPCRIVDTRAAGGAIPAGGTRSFLVAGSGLGGQGGVSAGCGIPWPWATGVVATVTAVAPSGNGFLRAWPYGDTEPTATLLNFTKNVGMSNTATLPICTSGCVWDLSVKVYGSATHVVIDVVGYLEPNRWALVNSDGTVSRSSMVASASSQGTGMYEVIFDRDVTDCAYSVNSGLAGSLFGPPVAFAGATGRYATPNGVWVETWDAAGANVNAAFFISVEC